MAENTERDRRLYDFGEFRLDAGERLLRRNGDLVSLPPKVFETLLLLVTHHGQILSKREILDKIWPDTFVEEGNLTQNIYVLRKTLGKASDEREWIETLPRKGYVFAGEVASEEPERFTSPSKTQIDRTVIPVVASQIRRLQIVIALAVLVTITAAAYLVYYWSNYRVETTVAAREIALKKLTFSGDVEFPVIAPDGSSFAYSKGGRLFIQPIDSETAREISLPSKMAAGFLQYLPDGRSIAFRNQLQFYLTGDVYSVPVEGGELRQIASNVWSGFGFSPDGRFVSFVRDIPERNLHVLVVRDISSGREENLAELANPSRFIFIGSPSWSHTGEKIAIAVSNRETQPQRTELTVYDVAKGTKERFSPLELKQFEQAVWMTGDTRLAVISRENEKFFQVWEMSYPQGRLSHITNDLNIYRGLSISADGKRMVAANYVTYSHIWTADATNLATQQQMTYGNLNRDGTVGLEWMSDNSIVYASRVFGNVDLWRVGPRDIDRNQLTRDAGAGNLYPDLSPDGKTIYFGSNRTGNAQIWKMDGANGGNQTQLTFGEKETNEFPQASPDGKFLYFLKKAKSETAIWRRTLSDGKDQLLEIDGHISPSTFLALSPDGKLLATSNLAPKAEESPESQRFQIAIVSTESRQPPRIFDLPSAWISWSPQANAFDYVENINGNARIWRQELDGSPAKPIFEERSIFIARIAWSNDGTRLAISKGKRLNDAVLITDF